MPWGKGPPSTRNTKQESNYSMQCRIHQPRSAYCGMVVEQKEEEKEKDVSIKEKWRWCGGWGRKSHGFLYLYHIVNSKGTLHAHSYKNTFSFFLYYAIPCQSFGDNAKYAIINLLLYDLVFIFKGNIERVSVCQGQGQGLRKEKARQGRTKKRWWITIRTSIINRTCNSNRPTRLRGGGGSSSVSLAFSILLSPSCFLVLARKQAITMRNGGQGSILRVWTR